MRCNTRTSRNGQSEPLTTQKALLGQLGTQILRSPSRGTGSVWISFSGKLACPQLMLAGQHTAALPVGRFGRGP